MKLDNLPEALTFDDVLLIPQYSHLISRSEVSLEWDLAQYRFSTPVIAANMDSICGEKMAHKMADLGALGIIHRRQPLFSRDECYEVTASFWAAKKRQEPLAFSVGSIHNDRKRIEWAVDSKFNRVDIICIDIAHGDTVHMLDTLEFIRLDKKFTGPIIAGNVCTPEATAFLLEHGATAVKVGVGPGSVCTTRIKTGCGYPQLSAIARCSEVGPVIADGGLRTPGDIAKALAVGAKAVMIGGMLAGTDCVPGWGKAQLERKKEVDRFEANNIGSSWQPTPDHLKIPPRIVYRGMASKEARQAVGEEETNAEGISKTVECKPAGSTEAVIVDILEGVKSAMSYTGAATLDEFRQKAKFVRVTGSTQVENHPHFKD